MSDSITHYKQNAYEQAVVYRKRGFTYTEIAKICGVSRGTVSKWLANEGFSQEVASVNKKRAYTANSKRLKLVNKARQAERNKQYRAILHQAETEYKHYRHSPAFSVGLALYFGLGDLNNPTVIRISSSRPEIHQTLIIFIQEYLGVFKKDIHFWLALNKEHDPVVCMKHWSKHTKLSIGQFYKHQTIIKGVNSKATLQFGCGNTIIGNTLLKKKLLHWIKLINQEVNKK